MIQQRLKGYVESILSEEQAGFRSGRGTIDQLFVIRQLAQKFYEKNKILYNNFIDFKQAFDSVWQEGLWQVLRSNGIPEDLIILLEDLYSKTISAVKVDGELTEWFRVTVGVRQGCGLSPYLFNLLLEAIMQWALRDNDSGVRVDGQLVSNLRFADDSDLITKSVDQLQDLTDRVNDSSKKFGLEVNVQKTKTMTIGKNKEQLTIKLGHDVLEQVDEFIYLGGLVSEDAQSTADIKRRTGLASAVTGQLNKIWRSKNVTVGTKAKLFETLVIPVFLYGSECWCLRQEDERRILAAEMSWIRRILGVSRMERKRNVEI